MKKITTILLVAAMLLSLSGCSTSTAAISPSEAESLPASSEVSSVISSEYPSSSSELSSTESELSSIVSEIKKANTESKASSKPPSSKPPSSKPASSKPPSSKPVPSSTPSSTPPPSSAPVSSEPAPPPVQQSYSSDQMKAVWLSFLEFQQFAGSDEYGFTSKIQGYFDNMVSLGLNTVIAQVRPHGDSFYPSQYYPWSKCVSGTMGLAVDYDPLKIMVEEAHTRGLAIHAWINPYRTMNEKEMALVDDTFPVKQWYNSPNRADYMVQVGTDYRWWLKPGNVEVQQLIINGAKEIAQNYNIDGIHLDDYFYGGSLSIYGDSKAEAKANTTALIKGLHDGIKSVKPSVQFGVSPAGGFTAKNSLPNSDLGYLSTDLQLWCQNPGYIDYVMPQVYWEYNHKSQPYTMTLNKWEDFVTEPSVKLYLGLAASNPDISDAEFTQQILDVGTSYRATGYCLYRYAFISGRDIP